MHLQVIQIRKETLKDLFFPESGLELTYSRARTLVMEMRGRGRGRGFRGGRGRGMLRNIKHQAHCKELEKIRERGREMREKKQAAWEERRRVREAIASSTWQPQQSYRRPGQEVFL